MLKIEGPWLTAGDRLVLLGDSLTASPNGYVKQVTERLAAKGISVTAAGRGGDKTPWALTRIERDVIAHKPTALMIFLGANDAAVGRGKWADEPRVTPEAADEMRARFVSADAAIAEEWARHPGHTGKLLTTDGVHMNERGNRIVAETMLRAWGLAE